MTTKKPLLSWTDDGLIRIHHGGLAAEGVFHPSNAANELADTKQVIEAMKEAVKIGTQLQRELEYLIENGSLALELDLDGAS